MSDTVLHINRLGLTIGGRRLLDDVTLQIRPGEIFGLAGASGSGKSMTSLAVMGLLPERARTEGEIRLGETLLTGLPDRRMDRLRGAAMGMVFQEPMTALNPLETIGAQIAEALEVHGTRATPAKIRALLERVGLGEIPPQRFAHQLSGGQRQRVVIAIAIAYRPRLLIADEPTTALDATTQGGILDLIRDLVAETRMGCLFITHDLGVMAQIADRLGIMTQGQLVESAPTKALLRAPRHPASRALLGAASHQPPRPPAPRDAPLLEARGLGRSYRLPRRSLFGPRPTFDALKNVSLTLRTGETLGLVGGSGCGKSTLARMLLGLEPLDQGRLIIDGTQVTDFVPPALRRSLQIVFQDPYDSFNPRHKVGRLIAEPLHLEPGRTEDPGPRIARALTDVGLEPADAEKFVHEFSGGQRQRIAIARALILSPKIVVLDEAVSALDVATRAQILDLLAELSRDKGLSYLFISHDLSVVRAISHRVLVMDRGEIVEEGTPEALFGAPKHPVTQKLIRAIPPLLSPPAQDPA